LFFYIVALHLTVTKAVLVNMGKIYSMTNIFCTTMLKCFMMDPVLYDIREFKA